MVHRDAQGTVPACMGACAAVATGVFLFRCTNRTACMQILPPRAPAPPDWPPFTVDLPPGGPPPSALRAASVTDAGLAQRVQLVPEMPSDRVHAPEGDAGRCAAEASGCGGGGDGGMPAWGRGLVLALLAAAVLAAIAALWAWFAVKRRRPRSSYLPAVRPPPPSSRRLRSVHICSCKRNACQNPFLHGNNHHAHGVGTLAPPQARGVWYVLWLGGR